MQIHIIKNIHIQFLINQSAIHSAQNKHTKGINGKILVINILIPLLNVD